MDSAKRRGRSAVDHASHTVAIDVLIAGLGPAGLGTLPASTVSTLVGAATVIVRTLQHPAAEELAQRRAVIACDDLYESHDAFESVYSAIADRVLEAAAHGPVVYAVPGSPRVGEFAVHHIRERGRRADLSVEVLEAASFIDALCDLCEIDPLRDGLAVLDGHDLPDPLLLQVPTIIAHLDTPVVVADVAARLSEVMAQGSTFRFVIDAGSPAADVWEGHPDDLDPQRAHVRASVVVDGPMGGLGGAIDTMRKLRVECPWDRQQTHHSIIPNLIEEAHELADALAALPREAPADAANSPAYAEVEDELGDVLLQVLFHVVMGEETGALRLDRVAETLRQKLVRRHPHVFGDAIVDDADDVRALWDQVKADEGSTGASILDGVPRGMAPLVRADKISRRAASAGFDWLTPSDVMAKFDEEVGELREAMDAGDADAVAHELGDVLFTTVNLGRHLDVGAHTALASAIQRVERRIRDMERNGPLDGLSLDELNRRWDDAKLQG